MAISAQQQMANYCAADVALSGVMHGAAARYKPPVITEGGLAFDLRWIDPAYVDAAPDAPIGDFERTRRFKYAGAAIAWARRRIFHGLVYGEEIEMHVKHLFTVDGVPREEENAIVDITLAGFREWDQDRYTGASLSRPLRKCRAARQ